MSPLFYIYFFFLSQMSDFCHFYLYFWAYDPFLELFSDRISYICIFRLSHSSSTLSPFTYQRFLDILHITCNIKISIDSTILKMAPFATLFCILFIVQPLGKKSFAVPVRFLFLVTHSRFIWF